MNVIHSSAMLMPPKTRPGPRHDPGWHVSSGRASTAIQIHTRPIDERIGWLISLAEAHSEDFCSPATTLARQRYLARHPTRVMVMKCMDGRVHIPHATHTPLGIIQPFRSLGGRFDLGWPYLGEVITHAVESATRAGHGVLLLITYHYSRGDHARGCAGFGCDTTAAMEHTQEICAQAEELFGADGQSVYPLVCGFETDSDALIIHNRRGDALDISSLSHADADDLPRRLQTLCPDMPAGFQRDLLPLLLGNLDHVDALRGADRELDIQHREWAICVGRGFDFLHLPNTALIIGPYNPDLSEPIIKAAGIIAANMAAGRIPDDGFLLLTSSPYEQMGVDRARARLKSRFLCEFAAQVIGEEFPDLARRMIARSAVVDWPTRRLELL